LERYLRIGYLLKKRFSNTLLKNISSVSISNYDHFKLVNDKMYLEIAQINIDLKSYKEDIVSRLSTPEKLNNSTSNESKVLIISQVSKSRSTNNILNSFKFKTIKLINLVQKQEKVPAS
jgi:hypothetical protein